MSDSGRGGGGQKDSRCGVFVNHAYSGAGRHSPNHDNNASSLIRISPSLKEPNLSNTEELCHIASTTARRLIENISLDNHARARCSSAFELKGGRGVAHDKIEELRVGLLAACARSVGMLDTCV